MPLLSCSAVKCIYNTEHYCSKGDIMVDGDEAVKSSETCCSSFCERGTDSASNCVSEPSGHIAVDCSACNCRYNEEEVCHAEKVDICGPNACQCKQTECGTFDKAW